MKVPWNQTQQNENFKLALDGSLTAPKNYAQLNFFDKNKAQIC